jgi:hypothetical protein
MKIIDFFKQIYARFCYRREMKKRLEKLRKQDPFIY